MVLPMENTEKMIFPGVGKYGIPEIKPETDVRIDRLEWIPVNYAMTATDKKSKGVHFYKDDYQFERFWNYPDKYIPILQQFGAVCSPDFSLYSVICRLRCSFSCTTKSTGLPHTGRRTAFTLSQRFAGAASKAMTGALMVSRETLS